MQVQSVAIGWQIYDMVRTPLALGLVGLCQFVPMFLCTLPAGELTDRFNQRRIYAWRRGCRRSVRRCSCSLRCSRRIGRCCSIWC